MRARVSGGVRTLCGVGRVRGQRKGARPKPGAGRV